jgi:hypothetical protein
MEGNTNSAIGAWIHFLISEDGVANDMVHGYLSLFKEYVVHVDESEFRILNQASRILSLYIYIYIYGFLCIWRTSAAPQRPAHSSVPS